MDKIYIETTKDLTFPELIQYAWNNNIGEKDFVSHNNHTVSFSHNGDFINYGDISYFSRNDTFPITTKEPITEDTVLDHVLALEQYNGSYNFTYFINKSIKQLTNYQEIHLLQPDNTFKRIWTKDRGILPEPPRYTGLVDNNGNKIYEYDYLLPPNSEIAQVYFKDGAFWIEYLNEPTLLKEVARNSEIVKS